MATSSYMSNLFTTDFYYFWTGIFLVVPAIFFILVRVLFIQSAITCAVPAEITVSKGIFLLQECWIKEKFYPPVTTPEVHDSILVDKEPYVTSPHSWIPYLLFVMFLFFTIPQGLRLVVKRNFGSYRKTCNIDRRQGTDEGKHLAAELVQEIEDVSSQKIRTVSFLLIKFLVFLNFLVHLLYISVKFRNEIRTVLHHNTSSGELIEYNRYTDEAFPKTVKCITKVLTYTSMRTYSLQCSMPINDVYESYFAILSVWFVLCAILSCINLVSSCAFCYHSTCTKSAFSRILPREDMSAVIQTFQGTDGLYLLWKICKKDELYLARDVVQILRGSIERTAKEVVKDDSSVAHVSEVVVESPQEQKDHLEVEVEAQEIVNVKV